MKLYTDYITNFINVVWVKYPNEGNAPDCRTATTSSEITSAKMLSHLAVIMHARNVQQGWWTDPKTGKRLFAGERNRGELLSLVHSEISEALEAVRKNLMDDKIPTRRGLEVELGDALIRLFDIIGSEDMDFGEVYEANVSQMDDLGVISPGANPAEMLAVAHLIVSLAYGGRLNDEMEGYYACLAGAVYVILQIGEALNLDLAGAVIEKDAYNRTRADHKLENRAKVGGKAF